MAHAQLSQISGMDINVAESSDSDTAIGQDIAILDMRHIWNFAEMD